MASRRVVTPPEKLLQQLRLPVKRYLIRPTVSLPVEAYTPSRICEFEAVEADLSKYFEKRKAARRQKQR
jgi:hypothetical protein